MRGRGTKFVLTLFWVLVFFTKFVFCGNVSYDHRALLIDGKRRVLISGSIHYPRSTPEMWPNLIQKSKEGGLDVIETYVFWNLHEPVRNQYDFEGRKDLVKFVKIVADAGLYVHLRIGPYVCAEWNYGGFPLWLHFIPGIQFRTDNDIFKAEMQRFTAKIVDMMKQENLYASQGGPVILSQIENEYGNVESSYGPAGQSYVKWAAGMAKSLDTGVPWVMCQQSDAPDPIINTCNGFYCDQYQPNSYHKPKMWTELYPGWFLEFGAAVPYRPVEDIAFAVARFFQLGGTFQNYYMYHGGTNFGRTSGGPFVATSYDYDAPIDEYGFANQPKWGHLKDLHKAIKLCEEALVATDPSVSSLGPNLEVAVYKSGSTCVAFLANFGSTSDATVKFNGNSYQLPAWSVSILPDCKNVALNTAKINSLTMTSSFVYKSLEAEASSSQVISSHWSYTTEPIGISKADAFTKVGLLEQINTTADKSDYLWYSISVDLKDSNPVVGDGSQSVLHVETLGHVLHAFINGKLAGSGIGQIALDIPVTLLAGKNTIDLLSVTVGLQNYGPFFDTFGAGITGPVILNNSKSGTSLDLSFHRWTYQIQCSERGKKCLADCYDIVLVYFRDDVVSIMRLRCQGSSRLDAGMVGLKGEALAVSTGRSTQWLSQSLPTNQPLTWYKASFVAPAGDDPVAIDFTGMGKGEAWVNGQSIGRFWPTYLAPNSGCSNCDYRGSYTASKCLKNCGKPSQTLYHVPRSWLNQNENTLVLLEEVGGNPTKISIAAKQIGSLCAHVSESHPSPTDTWSSDAGSVRSFSPFLSIQCPLPDQVISAIKFASFGTPLGTCGNFNYGECSSNRTLSIILKACIGSRSCSIGVSTKIFGDPCSGVEKSLAVEASCA